MSENIEVTQEMADQVAAFFDSLPRGGKAEFFIFNAGRPSKSWVDKLKPGNRVERAIWNDMLDQMARYRRSLIVRIDPRYGAFNDLTDEEIADLAEQAHKHRPS